MPFRPPGEELQLARHFVGLQNLERTDKVDIADQNRHQLGGPIVQLSRQALAHIVFHRDQPVPLPPQVLVEARVLDGNSRLGCKGGEQAQVVLVKTVAFGFVEHLNEPIGSPLTINGTQICEVTPKSTPLGMLS